MKRLPPEDELAFMQDIHAQPPVDDALKRIRASFDALQTRAQMALGLVTICLTITGFSGPQIAASGDLARFAIVWGVGSVLLSAIILFCGPLQLRWMTQRRAGTMEETVIALIERRNRRTQVYHLGVFFLLVGITGYVVSLLSFLLAQ